ncbi:MAG: Gfo/Idh/MocA family oxidoreductase [Xanthobacteraceae bacterium]|nr:Gfo/Idh/MocA family oxidoreductase [Xanthobacteraceae bacterium]
MARRIEMLRLGMIGLGGAAMQMLPSLIAHPRVRLAACAELNAQARERFAADFGAVGYDQVEALCADTEIDAVYIATPHQWHREHATMAAQAGKHIIVEKPMALTLEDCDAIIEAAERNGVRLVVGHTHSFDPPIRKMHEIINSGEIGSLAMINTLSYGNFLYRPRRPEELRSELGGGIIFNQVPHQMDVVRLLGGGMVRSVRAMAWMLDPRRPTEGSHMTFLQFESGATASIVFSGYDYFDSDEFHGWVGELGEDRRAAHGAARAGLAGITSPEAEAALKGSRVYAGMPKMVTPKHPPHCGVTIASCAGGDLRASPDGVTIYGRTGLVEVPAPPGRAFPDKEAVVDELYDAISCDCEPIHNGRWGKATMEACLAIIESARTGQEIMLKHQVSVGRHRSGAGD